MGWIGKGAAVAVVAMLAACEVVPPEAGDADPCGGEGRACEFAGAPPLELSRLVIRFPGRDYPFRTLQRFVTFRDEGGGFWIAPSGILTDGASIPPVFASVLGDPLRPEYRLAAALHDAYCGFGNEDKDSYHSRPWREVHRMFYQALRKGGTPETRAKTIYAGVMLAGPRWQVLRRPGDPPGPRFGVTDLREEVARGDPEALIRRLRAVALFIAEKNPSLSEIDRFIENAPGQRVPAAHPFPGKTGLGGPSRIGVLEDGTVGVIDPGLEGDPGTGFDPVAGDPATGGGDPATGTGGATAPGL